MRTLRAERHIERVEWVTVQVRWSQSRGGGEEDEDEEAYLDGMRRAMGGLSLLVDMLLSVAGHWDISCEEARMGMTQIVVLNDLQELVTLERFKIDECAECQMRVQSMGRQTVWLLFAGWV